MRAARVVAVACALACAALLTSASSAPAQDSSATPNLFLEKSYLSLLTPSGKNLVFEALPAAHFWFWNRYADLGWQKNGGWKLAAGASFLPEIRMSADRSRPVRTPGYRVRTNTEFVRLRRGDQAHRLDFGLVGVGVTAFGHYSNGQSGCRLRGYGVRAGAGADSICAIVDPVIAARGERNYDNGDFSTTYVAVALRGRRGKLSEERGAVRRQIGGSLEYQLHPLGMNPGGLDRELRRDYGGHQLSASVDAECRSHDGTRWSGVTRVALTGVTRFGPESRPIHRGSVELSRVFDRLHDFGVFARYHAGFDYYNIRLYERKPFLSVGVMWDVARLDFLNTEAVTVTTSPVELRTPRCFGTTNP